MSEDQLSPRDSKSTRLVGRALLVTGLAAPMSLGLAVFLGGSLYPGYSHVSQFISELGATGAPCPSVLNLGGLIPAGTLTFAFALAMYWTYRSGATLTISCAVVAWAGLSQLTAGVFPCDPGCSFEAMSRPAQIHALAGISASLSRFVAPLLFAVAIRARHARLFGPSLLLGAGALVALAVGFQQGADSPYVGILQRLHMAFFFTWVVIVAIVGSARSRSQ